MKILIGNETGLYSFNPATRKITLSAIKVGYDTVILKKEQILLVTNVTSNIMIYSFADPTLGGTIVNNVITVNYNTAGMNANDELQIFVELEDPTGDIMHLLKRMVKLTESLGNVDTSNRLRIAIDASPSLTVATLTTVTNPIPVGNIATIGGVDPRATYADSARIAYEVGIRSKITIS